MRSGPETAGAEKFFSEALLPALVRLGIGPVGAFRLEFGPETPTFYLLLPSLALDTLVLLDTHLAADAAFLKAAESFWNSPATSPAFVRLDGSLLAAFEGWPNLTAPAAGGAPVTLNRIFQLRIYESPSHAAHVRKVEMFNHGEFEIFTRTGLHPVFFAAGLVDTRLPSLTYMLHFSGMAELETNWATFSADPAWKQLSTSPRYNYESIVSNITNLILRPLACSQI